MTIADVETPARTPSEERTHRKVALAATFRLFARFGFDDGLAGHVTARDPERPDCFWVNPIQLHFAQVRVSDLLLVNEQGEVLEGERAVGGAAFAIHSQVHAARPDVVASAHAHSPYGMAWSSTGRLLRPLTQDACAYFEDHAVFEDFNGVVFDTLEGRQIAETLGDRKAVILKNHGLLTVGGSVEEAAWWFINMEKCCQVELAARELGDPIVADRARATHDFVGAPRQGRRNFQPMFEWIVAEEPDLVD